MPRILIACSTEWASPARLPAILRKAGLAATAFCAPGRPLGATRHLDSAVDAPTELDDFVEALREHLETTSYDSVLITDDPLLTALAHRRYEPWLDGILPIPAQSPWSRAQGSKAAFCQLGQAARLPIPASRVCRSLDDALAAAIALGMPLMLKSSSGFAGLGVRLVRDASELGPAWDALGVSDGDEVVAQTFIDGPIGNTVFYCHHGEPICWMSAYKVRTWPGPFGPSSARRFMDHPEALPLVRAVARLSGYHGFGALDWVLDDDGHLRLIELNTRPVPTLHMGPRAGVDFGRALAESLSGSTSLQPPESPPADAPVYGMFPEDLWRAASEKRLWRPADVPWTDPGLVLHHFKRLFKS
jgi:glutathione synthase/RimK-type ligase-like ATP-grasp enzyme